MGTKMPMETIMYVADRVYSQILMTESTRNEFIEWMKSGNFDREFEVADTICRKGGFVKPADFAMEAFKKFNS